MRTLPSRTASFLSFVLLVVIPSCCLAQAPLEPAQLPAQTSFYLI